MKRYLLWFLIVLLLFASTGCNQGSTDFLEPVNFYYCNDIAADDPSGNAFYNIFVAEVHEGAGYTDNLQALLSLYLQGPIDASLVSPFPAELQIISVEEADSKISIVVSNELASLTGLDLTIACACLSMTVMELLPCDSVQISAESALLDKHRAITMTQDLLVLIDDTHTVPAD